MCLETKLELYVKSDTCCTQEASDFMFGFDFSFQRIQSVTHVVLRKLQTLCLALTSVSKGFKV
jgi:hypothetical protein